MNMDSDEECPDLIDISNLNKNRVDTRSGNAEKVPVTIITGHLGSGKTTLLNYVLNEQHNKNKNCGNRSNRSKTTCYRKGLWNERG